MTIAADIAACLSILIMVAGGIILSVLLDKMYWIVDNRLLGLLGLAVGLGLFIVGFDLWSLNSCRNNRHRLSYLIYSGM